MSNDCISPSATLRPENILGKKKLKAKALQGDTARSSVVRRKIAEVFEEKVGVA